MSGLLVIFAGEKLYVTYLTEVNPLSDNVETEARPEPGLDS
jgi:hypothetical protein